MEPFAFERRFTPCAEFPNDNQGLHHGATWVCVELGRQPACELPRPRPIAPAIDEESRDLEATSGAGDGAPADSGDEIVSLLTISSSAREDLAREEQQEGPPGDVLDADGLADDAEPIEIVDELSFDDAAEERGDDAMTAEPSDEPPSADAFDRLVLALTDVARGLGAGDEGIACLDALFGQTRLEGITPGERAVEALVAGDIIAQGTRGLSRSRAFTAKVLAWQGILRGESEDFALSDGGALEPLDEWAADLLARLVGSPARADGIRRDLRRRGIAAFGLVAEAA